MLNAFLVATMMAMAGAEADQTAEPRALENLAKAGIGAVMSFVLDVPVSVEQVRLDRKNQRTVLTGLKIANPKGYSNRDAISIKEVQVEADPKSLFSHEPAVHLVRVSGAKVNSEVGLSHGLNLKKLMDNAKRFKSPKLFKAQPKKKWCIDKVLVEDSVADVYTPLSSEKVYSKPLDHMELTPSSDDGKGLTADAAVARILEVLIEKVGGIESLPFLNR